MDEDIPENLQCPICFNLPENEVYQCEDGHVICKECYGHVSECPQCRVPFGKKPLRNRYFEGLVDDYKKGKSTTPTASKNTKIDSTLHPSAPPPPPPLPSSNISASRSPSSELEDKFKEELELALKLSLELSQPNSPSYKAILKSPSETKQIAPSPKTPQSGNFSSSKKFFEGLTPENKTGRDALKFPTSPLPRTSSKPPANTVTVNKLNCFHCGIFLNSFYSKNGNNYCVPDYHKLFSPRCSVCNETISQGQTLNTPDGQHFHADCFRCGHCGIKINGGEDHYAKNGKFYCVRDYHYIFSPRCARCNVIITEEHSTALNKAWHQQCFSCRVCGKSLLGGYNSHQGELYCQLHYKLPF